MSPAEAPRAAAADTPADCFHCRAPLPDGDGLAVEVGGVARRVCCPGCQAAAGHITAAGLDEFYQHRAVVAPPRARAAPPDAAAFADYDEPQFQAGFVAREDHPIHEATLVIDGIACASCAWLNEQRLQRLAGVREVQVNYTTHRARVRWDATRVRLSAILAAIHALGYGAAPYSRSRQHARLEAERRTLLARLGVAAVLTAQVMMLAVATYAAGADGMDPHLQRFFRWVMLVLTVPVVAYSARAFYEPAWRALRRGSLGMDVPVSLAIAIAFTASVAATVSGSGEVYFDSVVMFTFLLLGGRYLELAARRRAVDAVENLGRRMPATALRLEAAGGGRRERAVPVSHLSAGDRVLVRPGEQVPADGRVLAGESGVDESLLTGEATPRRRRPGDAVIAGSVNVDAPLECEVTRTGAGTVIAQIVRLLERAQGERPALSRLADRVAAWFVGAVLVLAAAVAAGWWAAGDPRWLAITISVLVVTCPCALSLATPAAMSAATSALLGRGLLVVRGDAIEALARATHVIFDKTGTLTRGRPALVGVSPAPGTDPGQCLAAAAALEHYAVHPLAGALRAAVDAARTPAATRVQVHAGRGVEGCVDGRWLVLGSAGFVAARAACAIPAATEAHGDALVHLAVAGGAHTPDRAGRWLCTFRLRDTLRAQASHVVEALRGLDLRLSLLSGDRPAAVAALARRLGIEDWRAGLLPADKLERVRALQAGGARVAMIGDGVNDAPVLAGADVAIAVDSGTDLARAQADLVLLGHRLGALAGGFALARRTLTVMRQNLGWAVAYNGLALPAAAAGQVPPWLAALGMSLSSLVVVANALRLLRNAPAVTETRAHAWRSSTS